MRTTEQIRKELGVSSATIANWIKTGVIPPYPNGRYFDDTTYTQVVGNIKNDFNKLQKRANRSNNETSTINVSTISTNNAKGIIELLLKIYQESQTSLSQFMFSLSLHLLERKGLVHINENGFYSSNKTFTNFLSNWKFDNYFDLIKRFSEICFPEDEIDFLGSTYESLRTLNEKSTLGAFFTPHGLIADIDIPLDCTILDPCSGTGTFLLGVIKEEHNPQKITIRDIDSLALNIAKVNFALFFNRIDTTINIEIRNILFDKISEQAVDLFSSNKEKESFDIIVTNPPYGAKLTVEEKARLINDYPNLKTTESFSLALYNCLDKLSEKGKLYFILPESLLYVDTHFNIRKHIFTTGKKIIIRHFGNAFKGIMSKIIRLEIENTDSKTDIEVINRNIQWTIGKNILAKNGYRPPFISDVSEIEILDKILSVNAFTLQGKCKFGLGVVTGNNEAHLKEHFAEGLEPIFTGKELQPFRFTQPKYFIDFMPNTLQQVAPVQLYRQNKICYRFISDSIVTVADFDNLLILNSINFFIPTKDMPIKALSAFMNSNVVTFIYQRFFNSTKVLRNHFENLPIPKTFFDNIQNLTDLYNDGEDGKDIKSRLNRFVCNLYELSEIEYNHISKNV